MIGASMRRARSIIRPPAAGLIIVVVTWWLAIAGAVALTLPSPAASATPTAFAVVAGRSAHVHRPGMPSWPVPVERAAFDEARLGFREGDEAAVMHAFAAYEWIEATHGQPVWIAAVEGDAVQVEQLEGPHRGRRAWLNVQDLGPLS
jgi:hypothetical protein